jgi:hypothetical protein
MSFYFINEYNQLVYNNFNKPYIVSDCFSNNEEYSIEKNIKNIIEYSKVFLYENKTFEEFHFDNEQLSIHKQFIIRKLDYLIRLFENKIKSEIKEKYKMLENILNSYEFENIIKQEINNNKYISISRNILLEMILSDNEIQ